MAYSSALQPPEKLGGISKDYLLRIPDIDKRRSGRKRSDTTFTTARQAICKKKLEEQYYIAHITASVVQGPTY